MSDGDVSVDLNAAYRAVHSPVSASDILEAIVPGHWSTLTIAKRKDVDSILSMGNMIDASPGTRTDVLLTTAFAGKPHTLSALALLGKVVITRAAELSLLVTPSTVSAARAL